jgi:hypothetical protein
LDGNHISLFAIKFFAARKDFDEEVEVYRSSPLRHFMPSVLHSESNDNRSILDPFGGLLPPFIVMEKGESLQDRARNGRIDVFTAAQVCASFRSVSMCFIDKARTQNQPRTMISSGETKESKWNASIKVDSVGLR